MLHLLADDIGLVLVVGDSRCSVEGGDIEVVDGEAPGRKSTTQRSNARILLPEVVAKALESILFLASCLALNMVGTVFHVFGLVELIALLLHGIDLFLQIHELRLLPGLDLLLAEVELSLPVLDVEKWRWEFALLLTSTSKHTLTRSWHRATNLVSGSSGVSKHTVDRYTHVESELGVHDDLHTTALRLHEAITGGGGWSRHLLWCAAVLELSLGVAGGTHVGKLVGALFLEVIETTNEAHASLALHDTVVTDVDGLHSSGASSDWSSDGTGGGDKQHVDPGTHGVDERLLEDVLLQRLIKEAVLVHSTKGELVWIRDARAQQTLGSGDEHVERDWIDLGNDVVWHTVLLGIPTSRHLASNEAVKAEGLWNEESGTLLETDLEFTRFQLEDFDLLPVLTLELFSTLEWVEVLLNLDLLHELLLVRVVAVEQLWLDETDTRVVQDVLLVLGLDVLVVNRVARLGINPARVALTLELSVEVLDETHDPSHLNAALERELTVGFHLPSGSGVTPWSDFSKTGDHDNLLEVDHTLEVAIQRLNLRLPVGKLGKVELEVGTLLDLGRLVQSLAVLAVDDLVLESSLASDSLSDLRGLGDVLAQPGHQVLEVWQELKTTVQVSKDRLLLTQVDNGWSHETEQVEGHLLLREGADTVLLNAFCDDVVAAHESGTTSPSNNGTANETIVAESTVVRRQWEDDLSWSGFETTCGLLGLDSAKHTEQVGKHDTVSELRLAIDAVDFATVLGNGGERNDVVEVPAKALLLVVDVVDESVHVLQATLVEGHDDKLRTASTIASVHRLVVLGHLAREARGGDDDLGTTADQTLEDFSTDGACTRTSHEDVLVLVCDTRLGCLLEAIQVDAGELLAVFPSMLFLALEVQEWNSLHLALLWDGGAVDASIAALLDVAVELAVLDRHDLAFVHGERADDIAV
ncbi:hypothetical protein AC578_7604 [Pseudocercospora eumusae]|uniref:Uncharacterized protein n=1 Tax=Pseudocercospora eumusae TaxID=321146 RepID=A0A139HRP2_9PEZI|nr:hypothetical protein AC578_7604 [Pseudocercospora eumusae]